MTCAVLMSMLHGDNVVMEFMIGAHQPHWRFVQRHPAHTEFIVPFLVKTFAFQAKETSALRCFQVRLNKRQMSTRNNSLQ